MQSVGRYLSILSNSNLVTVHVPFLDFVGSYITIQNNALHSLSLTSLQYVGDYFSVSGNGQLQSLSLPALEMIEEDLLMIDNAVLESFEMEADAVRIGRAVSFSDNAILANLDLSNIISIPAALTLNNNAQLCDVDVAGLDYVGFITISGSPNLDSLCILPGSQECTLLGDLREELISAGIFFNLKSMKLYVGC